MEENAEPKTLVPSIALTIDSIVITIPIKLPYEMAIDYVQPAAIKGVPVLTFLSTREREILPHLIEGKPNKAIGDILFVTERTIKFHVSNLLKKYNLNVSDILQGRHKLRARLEAEALPQALSARFDDGEQVIKALVDGLREPLTKLDQTLVGALDTASEKMLYQFNGLRAKAGRAEGFRTGVLNTHESEIAGWVFPNNALQERSFGLLTFLAAEGPELLDHLDRYIKVGTGEHCFLSLQPTAK